MDNSSITEAELVLPSLYLMSLNEQGCISTSELIKLLTRLLNPKGIDAEILANRNDTHFSQKVRNLKSHNTLTKYGYASYSNGVFYITDKGIKLVESNKTNINYIMQSGFTYKDVKASLGKVYKARASVIIPYEELMSEGETIFVETKSRQRSHKLRDAAIDHFSKNGIIACDCCGFEFKSFYGDIFGSSCIEIHHLKPIFQYASMSVVQTIDEALKNLLPVCPNCHRVIHRNRISSEQIPLLKEQIRLHVESI